MMSDLRLARTDDYITFAFCLLYCPSRIEVGEEERDEILLS